MQMTNWLKRAVFAVATVYVSTNVWGVTHVAPGNTDDAAAINAAIATAATGDGIVQLADGTYNLTSLVTLSGAVELRGNDADRAAVVLDGGGMSLLLELSNTSAFAHGMTFANGYSDKTDCAYGHGPVLIKSGCVSNSVCRAGRGQYFGGIGLYPEKNGEEAYLKDTVIYDCSGVDTGNAGIGGGLRFYGSKTAVAERCVIYACNDRNYGAVRVCNDNAKLLDSVVTNCTKAGVNVVKGLVSNCVIRACSRSGNGGGIVLEGGTVQDTFVTDCSSANGGGVYMTGGTLRNCTVAGNTAEGGPGVYQTGGTIASCVIWNNGPGSYTFISQEPSLSRIGGTVKYTCAAQAPAGNGNINNLQPLFTDAANGDYSLSAVSPCFGAGENGVDMGCNLTAQTTVPACRISYAFVDGLAPAYATFTAMLTGNCGAVESCVWDFGDGSAPDSTSGMTVGHVYASSGQYTISVQVTTANAGTLSCTIEKAVTLGAKEVYIAPSGEGAFPYATPETAGFDIARAVSALVLADGEVGKVHLADGTYPVSSVIAIKQPLEFIGNDADRSNVILDGGGKNRVIFTKNAQAFVHGVTIQNGKITGGDKFEGIDANYAGAAFTAGGVFSNCTFRSMQGQYDTIGISNGGVITDCEIWNGKNTDGYGPGAANGGGVKMASGVLRRCLVAGCYASYGGGLRVNGGLVDSCVISNCYSSTGMGGGIYQTSGVVSNCVITCNTQNSCRGVYMTGGTMVGCLVTGNKGATGGGVYKTGGTLRNCTVTGNSFTTSNGGVVQTAGAIENCLIVYNGISDTTDDSLAASGGTVTYTCAWNHPAAGAGNISADPMFADAAHGDYRLNGASLCVDAGTNAAWGEGGKDLAGGDRIVDGNGDDTAVIDIGAYEYDPATAPPACSFEVTSGASGFAIPATTYFKAYTQGAVGTVNGYIWDFGDGTCVTTTTDTASHEYTAYGVHTVSLSLDCTGGAVSAFAMPGAVSLKPSVVYVSLTGSDTSPYDTPEKATPDFNAAIDMVAVPSGGLGVIHVAAGTYARAAAEEIVVSKAVWIVGDEGAEQTVVDGNNKSAMLLRVSHDAAVIEGITFDNRGRHRVARLEKGTIRNCILTGGNLNETGGIIVDKGLIEDTVIRNSSSWDAGYGNSYANGGFYICGGTMRGCVVSNCTADCQTAGTIEGGTVTNCSFVLNSHGGGQGSGVVRVLSGALFNSRIVGNRSSTATGGVAGLFAKAGTVRNCLVADNASKGDVGLKAEIATVESCTIAANVSSGEGYVAGVKCTGAANICNVLAWGNVGTTTNSLGAAICTTCLFDSDPHFRNPQRGDYRTSSYSSARNTGTTLPWMTDGATDLAGNPRILNGKVDIGCFECEDRGLIMLMR